MSNSGNLEPIRDLPTYDDYADAYATSVQKTREPRGVEGDPFGILPIILDLLGDVAGQAVLDAGCGEGYLARILAARGAVVTGIDASPRLIAMARRKGPPEIDYRVADLSRPLPADGDRFDAIASYLVLNDVVDYRGLASTLSSVLKPGGRMVHALNNPYGAVVGKHVADYFDSGAVSPYGGLLQEGIKTYYHHRTMEEYLDSFLEAGAQLTKLADVHRPAITQAEDKDSILPSGYIFPRFTVLAFAKPER